MKKPFKILQVGMTSILGGLETYLIEQYRHIDLNKIHYDFINITGEYTICYDEEIRSNGSKIFSIPSRHKNPLAHYWGWIKLLSNHREYDAIVLNTNSLEYVFPLFIGKIFKIPLRIIHSHNSGFENKQGIVRKALVKCNQKLLNWSANQYFACSQVAGEWMFPDKKFEIIYNAIDCDPYRFAVDERRDMRDNLDLKDEEFAVLHVGRFTYQKNHNFLIEIFAEIKAKEPKSKLFLVGDISENTQELCNLYRKIKELDLVDDVIFLGRRHDVNKIMKACDVLIMPSYFEGLTLVAVEAQAANLPICISDTTTKEVAISDAIEFIDLKLPSTDWADKALSWRDYQRHDVYDLMGHSGFEINTEARRVEKIYETSLLTQK